jgi:hypothetical protein
MQLRELPPAKAGTPTLKLAIFGTRPKGAIWDNRSIDYQHLNIPGKRGPDLPMEHQRFPLLTLRVGIIAQP